MTKLMTILFILIAVLIACTEAESTPPASPPVVGTPLAGPPGYISVGGNLSFSPSVAGVTISVNSVEIQTADPEGLRPADGYVFVVLDATVENDSRFLVFSGNCMLVDDYSNQYAAWSIPFERPVLERVEVGERSRGDLVYQVPAAALSEELRLRWESELHRARIEIMLGHLTAELESRSP